MINFDIVLCNKWDLWLKSIKMSHKKHLHQDLKPLDNWLSSCSCFADKESADNLDFLCAIARTQYELAMKTTNQSI